MQPFATLGRRISLLVLAGGCASSDVISPLNEMGATGSSGTESPAGNPVVGSGGSASGAGTTNAGGASGSSGSGGTSSVDGSSNAAGTINAGGSSGDGGSMSCVGGSGATGPTPALVTGTWINISPPGLYRPGGSKPSYGCMDIHVAPCSPSTLYVTTDIEGMWKSTDGGSSWKQIGNLPAPISPGVIEIDPRDARNMYYIGGVRGSSFGFWISKDGGDTWIQPAGFTAKANNSVGGWTPDMYDVKADPADWKHVLLTFHSGFEFTGNAGVLESKDGGTTWIRHWPSGWGAGHSVWFLGDRSTWLVGTQNNGFWRTTDAGTTWKQVSTTDMQHGGTSNYYSKTGVLYVGGLGYILRSADNGLTFELVGTRTQDGYYAIIGDGNSLYSLWGNGGDNTTGPQSYMTSPESDGTMWSDYNTQKFTNGPYRMAFDSVNRIVYSANWNAGVWALKVR
jgi:hypothetical protein